MGCSSGNAIEENKFQKTGNPKRDFFYCFDDQEVQLIEEKKKKCDSPDGDYSDLYSRYEIDYTKEKDESLILKQYIAVYVLEDYAGDYVVDDIQNFHIKACEIIGFKINDKEAALPKFENMDNGFIYCGIRGQISKSDHVEPFKDLLIIEITYKIKQFNVYNTRSITLERGGEEYFSASMNIYFDKNKIEVESKQEENLSSLKNGMKFFNRTFIYLWIRNKEKIKFNQEEEALLKKKFNSEEISNIYSAFDKIGALKDYDNLIFEKCKFTFNKGGTSKVEGKVLIIANERRGKFLVGNGFNYTITELKVNDKPVEKKPMDYEEEDQLKEINYFKSDNGANNTYFNDLKPLNIIEFKIELLPKENLEEDEDKYSIDFKNLFGVDYLSGGYYNYEIVPNNAKLIFEPGEERYKPKKTGNSIIYSGFYKFDEKEYDDEKYLKETGQVYANDEDRNADKDNRLRDWLMTKKLSEFHPLKFKIE